MSKFDLSDPEVSEEDLLRHLSDAERQIIDQARYDVRQIIEDSMSKYEAIRRISLLLKKPSDVFQ